MALPGDSWVKDASLVITPTATRVLLYGGQEPTKVRCCRTFGVLQVLLGSLDLMAMVSTTNRRVPAPRDARQHGGRGVGSPCAHLPAASQSQYAITGFAAGVRCSLWAPMHMHASPAATTNNINHLSSCSNLLYAAHEPASQIHPLARQDAVLPAQPGCKAAAPLRPPPPFLASCHPTSHMPPSLLPLPHASVPNRQLPTDTSHLPTSTSWTTCWGRPSRRTRRCGTSSSKPSGAPRPRQAYRPPGHGGAPPRPPPCCLLPATATVRRCRWPPPRSLHAAPQGR